MAQLADLYLGWYKNSLFKESEAFTGRVDNNNVSDKSKGNVL
jgi:hypothetical protein